MAPTKLLLSSFLLALQFAIKGKSKQISLTIPDLHKHCEFELGGYGYNICSLVGQPTRRYLGPSLAFESDVDDNQDGPSDFHKLYVNDIWIVLGGFGQSELPENTLCDEDTWICLSDSEHIEEDVRDDDNARSKQQIDRSSTKSRPIIRRAPGSEIVASIDVKEDNTDSNYTPPLRLVLRNEQPSLTWDLTLACEARGYAFHIPKITGYTVSIPWSGPNGCPTKRPREGSPPVKLLQEPSDDEVADEGEEKQSDDNDLLPNEPRRLRPWIAFIVVIALVTLAFTCMALSSPRARHYIVEHFHSATYAVLPFLSLAAVKLKPIGESFASFVPSKFVPFRQGDSSLVQWAEEEMALDSEDVMVNARGTYEQYDVDVEGWNTEGMDEYIPLTFSPKYGRGRRVRTYGSTPEVETFTERGAMGGLGRFFKR